MTSTELDDILKLNFPEALQNKRLKPIFREFESLQNKILIDYKKFRNRLLQIISVEGQKKAISESMDLKKQKVAEKLY